MTKDIYTYLGVAIHENPSKMVSWNALFQMTIELYTLNSGGCIVKYPPKMISWKSLFEITKRSIYTDFSKGN